VTQAIEMCGDFPCGGGGSEVGFRRLVEGGGGGVNAGHCEQSCSRSQLFSCKTEPACELVGGSWIAPPAPPPDCVGCTQGVGSCQEPCSVSNPYNCVTDTECTMIGGTFRTEIEGCPTCSGKFPGCTPVTPKLLLSSFSRHKRKH